MADSIVAVTRCVDYSREKLYEAVGRQFELLGGVEKFVSSGDSVLLKPNFIAPKRRRQGAQTDPAFVVEVARFLKDYGARPFVGDSPAWGNVYSCVKALKMGEELKSMSVPVRQLNRPKNCFVGEHRTKVGVSTVALDADVIINLPKFKSHQQLVATFAVKNMFGCVSGKRKAYWHFAKGGTAEGFCEFLIEIFKYTKPALTIIDAVVAMEGPGPINGVARELGWIVGGVEPIACEAVCARLVNLEPGQLPMVRAAKRLGFGCFDFERIEVAGDDFSEDICKDFEFPELIPVRFSLPYVFRSVCKQVVLLAKEAAREFRCGGS